MLTNLGVAIVAMTLGQEPPEAVWLERLPADVPVVARVRSIEDAREDLSAMVAAMSPALAGRLGTILEPAMGVLSSRLGTVATRGPLLALIRLPDPEAPTGMPAVAVVVPGDDLDGLRRGLAGGREPRPETRSGGYEALVTDDGRTAFLARGEGFVTFGTDEGLIADIAEPGGATLGAALSGDLRGHFLDGDLGVFVNLSLLRRDHEAQLGLLRDVSDALFRQLGVAAGNPGVERAAGIVYDQVDDALRDCTGLALGADLDAGGLAVAGAVRVVPGSDLEAKLADAHPGTTERLARLPVGAAHYRYLSADPDDVAWMERLVLAFVGRDAGADDPEVRRIRDLYRQAGNIELVNATTTEGGFRWIYQPIPEDAMPMVQGMGFVLRAMGGDGREGFGSGVTFEPNAVTYRGYTLHHARVTFDYDRLARRVPANPRAAEPMRAFFGGDAMNEWFGTDGERILSSIAPDWETARAQIDAYLDGDRDIGSTAAFARVRPRLPERVSALELIDVAALVRPLDGPTPVTPGALGVAAGEPALLGVALTASPTGYRFDLYVPPEVGPPLERGLTPLLGSLPSPAE